MRRVGKRLEEPERGRESEEALQGAQSCTEALIEGL
jgi:hypothetical protein